MLEQSQLNFLYIDFTVAQEHMNRQQLPLGEEFDRGGRQCFKAFVFFWDFTTSDLPPEVLELIVLAAEFVILALQPPDLRHEPSFAVIVDHVGSPRD